MIEIGLLRMYNLKEIVGIMRERYPNISFYTKHEPIEEDQKRIPKCLIGKYICSDQSLIIVNQETNDILEQLFCFVPLNGGTVMHTKWTTI